MKFQSTLPRGERLKTLGSGMREQDFNPRSHEGSDIVPSANTIMLHQISIHAPTRGATHPTGIPTGVFEFQSTLPRGERRSKYARKNNRYPISIHAPTRGATISDRSLLPCPEYFNPRSHEGSDIIWFFVSTMRTFYFNPRSHEGSDGDNKR